MLEVKVWAVGMHVSAIKIFLSLCVLMTCMSRQLRWTGNNIIPLWRYSPAYYGQRNNQRRFSHLYSHCDDPAWGCFGLKLYVFRISRASVWDSASLYIFYCLFHPLWRAVDYSSKQSLSGFFISFFFCHAYLSIILEVEHKFGCRYLPVACV